MLKKCHKMKKREKINADSPPRLAALPPLYPVERGMTGACDSLGRVPKKKEKTMKNKR